MEMMNIQDQMVSAIVVITKINNTRLHFIIVYYFDIPPIYSGFLALLQENHSRLSIGWQLRCVVLALVAERGQSRMALS